MDDGRYSQILLFCQSSGAYPKAGRPQFSWERSYGRILGKTEIFGWE